jgi:hypothetical protein
VRRQRRQTGGGWVGGGGAEVNEKEDVLRRRSPTIKTMKQRPMCRRKLTDEGTEEEAGSPILPCCEIGGPMQFPKKGVSVNILQCSYCCNNWLFSMAPVVFPCVPNIVQDLAFFREKSN